MLDRLLALPAALRAAGVPVAIDRSAQFVAAVAHLDLARRADVYWAGRATLCADPEHIPTYDVCFVEVFGGRLEVGIPPRPDPMPVAASDAATTEPGESIDVASASDEELLRNRDVAELTDEEREQLWREFAALRVRQPQRRSRRFSSAEHGRIDPRATVRAHLARAGEPAELRRRRPRPRPMPIVLLVDVSGSMQPYADTLLRWAHRIVAQTRGTEVFTMGTRLSRVTGALRPRDPAVALELVGRSVPDWSGGTRLGESLELFRRRWGRRGMARGAVVLIASDGFERGDAVELGRQVAQLGRLARALVWVSPHRGKPGYRPVQGGIAAALPHLDALLGGHSLTSLQTVLDLLSSREITSGRARAMRRRGPDAREPGEHPGVSPASRS